MSKNNKNGSFSGKGYYIALVLCAVAIGITGFFYYRNTASEAPQLSDPASATVNSGADVEAVATQPGQTQSGDTNPGTQSTEPAKKPMQVVAPLEGQTAADYSMEALSYNVTTRDWRVHNGVDIAAEAGTKVCAAAEGTVYTVYEDETMGNTVVISHRDGYTTRYSSLAAEVSVKAGDTVRAGQTIGTVGNTALLETAIGDHLHFSVSCNGEIVDPADFLS